MGKGISPLEFFQQIDWLQVYRGLHSLEDAIEHSMNEDKHHPDSPMTPNLTRLHQFIVSVQKFAADELGWGKQVYQPEGADESQYNETDEDDDEEYDN